MAADDLHCIVVLGDPNVGKTSFLNRLVTGKFGVEVAVPAPEFLLHDVTLDGEVVKLKLRDTAGQERYRTLTGSYFRGIQGVFILFDVSEPKTFENVRNWNSDLENYADENCCKLLLGNKTDIAERAVTVEMANELSDELQIPYLEMSVKTGDRTEEAIATMAKAVSTRFKVAPKEELIKVKPGLVPNKKKGGCC
ncbi:small GTP-binding protein of Rab family [Pelomyxa schiedti]|nr:small GTP-binding protein of Rab family [Pelomyxa schiedti]